MIKMFRLEPCPEPSGIVTQASINCCACGKTLTMTGVYRRDIICEDCATGATIGVNVINEDNEATREALEGMVYQFGYWNPSKGGHTTGGLSALECAFEALGWDDPHICPDVTCDEPGCLDRVSCGTPTKDGYRRTCGEHIPKGETNE